MSECDALKVQWKLRPVFVHREVPVLSAAVHTTGRSVLRHRQLFEGSSSERSAECSRVSEDHDEEVNMHAEQVAAT
jgi:hypothetical protein